MRKFALLLVLLAPMPAAADTAEVVTGFILPGYGALAAASADLARAADASCAQGDLAAPFAATFEAWARVQHLHFGPIEVDGRALAVQFWPDPKGAGARAQRALLMGGAPSPAGMAEASVAARGLPALERLIYPAAPLPADPCPLIRATATDLAVLTAQISAEWAGGYGDVMQTAGQAGNATYLSPTEARQALFTQLVTGLEFAKDSRLGRPLSTFDAPQPARAEAAASGRSLANLRAALAGMRDMAALLADAPQTLAAVDRALALVDGLKDPRLAGVAQPATRLKIEIVQQAVAAARDAALAEMGPALGVSTGFNAADGD